MVISVLPHALHLFPIARITSFGVFKSNPEYSTVPHEVHVISSGKNFSDHIERKFVIKVNAQLVRCKIASNSSGEAI